MFKIAQNLSFKKIIAFILMGMMGIVVVFSIISLGVSIVEEIFITHVGLINVEGLPSLFGLFLWVMVGIELFDAVKMYMLDHEVHVETILTVGIIAISNHVIATDLVECPALTLFAISAILLALSTGYFLVRKSHTGPEHAKIETAKDEDIPENVPVNGHTSPKHWLK